MTVRYRVVVLALLALFLAGCGAESITGPTQEAEPTAEGGWAGGGG